METPDKNPEQIKAGDIVRPISGGSRTMSVVEVVNDIAKCMWVNKGIPQFDDIPIFLLTKQKRYPAV